MHNLYVAVLYRHCAIFTATDLQCSRLITNPPKSLGSLLIAYNTTLSSLYLTNMHQLLPNFPVASLKSNLWFTSTLRAFKSKVSHTENIWKRAHSALDSSTFKSLRNRYHSLILASEKQLGLFATRQLFTAHKIHSMVSYCIILLQPSLFIF